MKYFLALTFVFLLGLSDKIMYDLGRSNGGATENAHWKNELIQKDFAGYNEKNGAWDYLKDSDVLLRLLIKYNTESKPAVPELKGFKLELNEAGPLGEKDYLAENEKFSLIMPSAPQKSKKKN